MSMQLSSFITKEQQFVYYNISLVLFNIFMFFFKCSLTLGIAFYRYGNEKYRVMVIVFNATFNNNSAISWRSLLLVEETVVP